MKTAKIKEMISQLSANDFVGVKDSEVRKGHKLWEFVKEYRLEFYGIYENVLDI